jgi:hypothetical protein
MALWHVKDSGYDCSKPRSILSTAKSTENIFYANMNLFKIDKLEYKKLDIGSSETHKDAVPEAGRPRRLAGKSAASDAAK